MSKKAIDILKQKDHFASEIRALKFYRQVKFIAFYAKAGTQMLIGFCIFLLLLAKVLFLTDTHFHDGIWVRWGGVGLKLLFQTPTLDLVGQALALSAGVELSYMLFTPGPDEAIEPVILGLAASTLIIASDGKSEIKDYLVIPIYILTIGLLFLYKRKFIDITLE